MTKRPLHYFSNGHTRTPKKKPTLILVSTAEPVTGTNRPNPLKASHGSNSVSPYSLILNIYRSH